MNKTIRRLMAILFAGTLCVSLITGCGKAAAQEEMEPDEEYYEEEGFEDEEFADEEFEDVELEEYVVLLSVDFTFLRAKMRYNTAHTPPTTKVASPGTPRKADPIPVMTNIKKQIKNFFILLLN